MTLTQVEKRLAALEKQVGSLWDALEYQHAVEGIRRGLESADRGEGQSVPRVFSSLRRKHKLAQRR